LKKKIYKKLGVAGATHGRSGGGFGHSHYAFWGWAIGVVWPPPGHGATPHFYYYYFFSKSDFLTFLIFFSFLIIL
jgi:hypothetical protein